MVYSRDAKCHYPLIHLTALSVALYSSFSLVPSDRLSSIVPYALLKPYFILLFSSGIETPNIITFFLYQLEHLQSVHNYVQ